ncbi:unnamed protein product, partial [marine sediment metagenome]
MHTRHRVIVPFCLLVSVSLAGCGESKLKSRIAAKKRAYEGSAESVLQSIQEDYDKAALKLFEERERLEGAD